jgi:hypothetical protein
MSTQSTVVVVALVVVLLVLAVAAARRHRTSRLRNEFGGEYDRTVDGVGKRRQAEKDLAARKEEHAQLELRPLSAAARERYTSEWTQVQARFVDAPAMALSEADTLVTRLLAERGYPTDGFDEQSRLLSVEHAHVLDGYRAAHDVELTGRTTGQVDTEAVRNAMLDFRRVFEDVIGEDAHPYPEETETGTTQRQPRSRR